MENALAWGNELVDSVSQYRRRTRLTAYAVSSLIGILLILLNVPWRYAQVSDSWMGQPFTMTQQVPTLSPEQITRAGWPWRYQVLIDDGSEGNLARPKPSNALAAIEIAKHTPKYWSSGALLCDAVFALALVYLVFRLWCWRGERIAVSENPERTRRRFDVSVAVGCFLFPAGLIFSSHWIAKTHLAKIQSVGGHGAYQFTFEAPAFLEKRIPTQLHPSFLRLRRVEILSPTNEALQTLFETPTLRSVFITDGTLDEHSLDPLSRATELTSLALSHSSISRSVCEDIRNCERLIFLGIKKCNVDAEMVTPINEMDKLQHVDLRGNPLSLSVVSKPKWSSSCRSLLLSRPRPGQEGHLNLSQWPNLVRLSVRDSIRIYNEATLKLSLTDMPSLQTIELDRSQKHSLHARNLPRFRQIVEPIDLMLLYGREDRLNGLTRFESIDLRNVPNLRRLECHAADLKELRLEDVGRLKEISLGVYGYNSHGLITSEDPIVVGNDAWIQEIAQTPSLTKVDLAGVHFSADSFEQLASLSYLKQLHIQKANLTPADLSWVFGLDQLQSLAIRDCRISAEWLQRCLAELPKLRSLHADLSDLEELTIAENQSLTTLDDFEVSKMTRLELRSLPRLRGSIQIRGEIEELRLVDLPVLDELLIESPWPQKATLQGLTKLRYFGGGGPELDDQVIDQLLKFKRIDHLMLAYPKISKDRLEALGQYWHLTGLEVPGCQVDDEVASHWTKLLRLRVANFDDTQISSRTFHWLHAIPSLRRLSIARVPLDADARRTVSSLTQLSSLNLSGVDFPAEDLQRLLAAGNLEALNLAGCPLNEDHLRVLGESNSLRRVVLKDCLLRPQQIANLLRLNPRLTLDLGVQDQTFFVNFAPPHRARLIGCRVRGRSLMAPNRHPFPPSKPRDRIVLDESAFPDDIRDRENADPMIQLVSGNSDAEVIPESHHHTVVDLAEFRMQSERAFSTELFRLDNELAANK
ncbi:MAG: protein kinase [Rhodopirellula sp. JB055]|uniref:protein kinase n=1 Tax=Rhodopirellula sp. JB055 TaxID=3342846 RepID=UPI003709EE86